MCLTTTSITDCTISPLASSMLGGSTAVLISAIGRVAGVSTGVDSTTGATVAAIGDDFTLLVT